MNEETRSLDDFNQLISEHYSQLTKSEKAIADFVRQNQDEAAFLCWRDSYKAEFKRGNHGAFCAHPWV